MGGGSSGGGGGGMGLGLVGDQKLGIDVCMSPLLLLLI